MAVTINEGTTFLISDDLGDVPEEGTFGLFCRRDAAAIRRWVSADHST
jgi:hypothetical protein